MNSLAYSSTENGTTAVITVTIEDGSQVSLPISSITGGPDEADFFAAINAAIADYRSGKGF